MGVFVTRPGIPVLTGFPAEGALIDSLLTILRPSRSFAFAMVSLVESLGPASFALPAGVT